MTGPILVTGGSGFIGSHICDAISASGRLARVFDREPSQHLSAGQEMIVGDIMSEEELRTAAAGCDALIHVAGQANIDSSGSRLAETLELNILGVMNALQAAHSAGVGRFVFASSVYVLSRHGSFYAMSKRAAEDLIQTFSAEFDLDYTILRYGSVYGRRAGVENTIHRLVSEALSNRSLSYHGFADAVREYIHVSDVARMTVDLLAPEFRNRAIVLTGTERLTVRDVMRLVAEIAPDEIDLVFEDGASSHYAITPYAFRPDGGRKIVPQEFVDLAQGILDIFDEIHVNKSDN